MLTHIFGFHQTGSTCKNASGIIGAKVSKTKPVALIANYDVNTMMAVLDSRKLLAVAVYASTTAFNGYKGYVKYKLFCFIQNPDNRGSYKIINVYSPGVFTDTACGTKQANHQITAVGYGTDSNGVNYWV